MIRNSVKSLERNMSELWSMMDLEIGPDHGHNGQHGDLDTVDTLAHNNVNGNTNNICDL